ncbi:hypothetical protein JZ751_003068 [Albula glossodonta]|uniref:Uncharacterized protein n=1 Tax=Albula glossodonta TaxID=121402 RepID=A0A8T2NBL0_9TELE|nr:hypothetical protein JZ751_003068 [Albula glossodonta]
MRCSITMASDQLAPSYGRHPASSPQGLNPRPLLHPLPGDTPFPAPFQPGAGVPIGGLPGRRGRGTLFKPMLAQLDSIDVSGQVVGHSQILPPVLLILTLCMKDVPRSSLLGQCGFKRRRRRTERVRCSRSVSLVGISGAWHRTALSRLQATDFINRFHSQLGQAKQSEEWSGGWGWGGRGRRETEMDLKARSHAPMTCCAQRYMSLIQQNRKCSINQCPLRGISTGRESAGLRLAMPKEGSHPGGRSAQRQGRGLTLSSLGSDRTLKPVQSTDDTLQSSPLSSSTKSRGGEQGATKP